MIVVLDTNVLLGCISRSGELRPIWDASLQKRFVLAISIDIFLEYSEKTGTEYITNCCKEYL